MKPVVRVITATAFAVLFGGSLFAASTSAIGDVVKAQIIINQVLTVVDKYKTLTVELEAPVPMANNGGKYLLPYKANGEVTDWAAKATNAQVGKVVGEKAGGAAANAVASKIPFGGVAAGLIKKKTQELAAVTALGGMDFIKKSSEISTDNLNDYAVFLHVRHSKDSDYKEVLAAAMGVYPDLEGRFEGAISDALRQQAAKAGKKI